MKLNIDNLPNEEKIFQIMWEKIEYMPQWRGHSTNDGHLLKKAADLAKKFSPQEINAAFNELEEECPHFPGLKDIIQKIEDQKKVKKKEQSPKKFSKAGPPKGQKVSDTEKIFDLIMDRRSRFRNWRRDATDEACADFAQWLGQDYSFKEVKEGLDIVCKEQTFFPSYDIIFKAISRYISRNLKEREQRILREANEESGNCELCSNNGHLVMWEKERAFHMIFKCACKRGSLFPNYQSILSTNPAHWQLRNGDKRIYLRDYLARKKQFIQNGIIHTLS
jgi:hypothetical protein